jgi:stage II sporulation protein D
LQYSTAELAKKIGLNDGVLLAVNTELNAEDGRVSLFKFKLSDGRQRKIQANELRKLIGYNILRSTNFTVKQSGDRIEFSGKGFGHGVGLCQWGSRTMAQRGASYSKILNHYYPEARLGRVGTL